MGQLSMNDGINDQERLDPPDPPTRLAGHGAAMRKALAARPVLNYDHELSPIQSSTS